MHDLDADMMQIMQDSWPRILFEFDISEWINNNDI